MSSIVYCYIMINILQLGTVVGHETVRCNLSLRPVWTEDSGSKGPPDLRPICRAYFSKRPKSVCEPSKFCLAQLGYQLGTTIDNNLATLNPSIDRLLMVTSIAKPKLWVPATRLCIYRGCLSIAAAVSERSGAVKFYSYLVLWLKILL